MSRFQVQLLATLMLSCSSCSHGEPPSPDAGPTNIARLRHAGAPALPSDGGLEASSATARPLEDAGALPQTNERPPRTSAAFDARARALLDGITHDRVDEAMPFFFPLAAYEQVKDVAQPARDYRLRLVAAYERDIHELHRELGASLEGATFESIEVPESRGRWVEPHEEYNKLGYYRVYATELRFKTKSGRLRAIPLKSLISWRGEWYVVHLSSIK